jgi:hypothetical protein
LAALSGGDDQQKRKRGEVQRRLAAIKTIADELAANENYASALTLYEVLFNEISAHFNAYRDEYVVFNILLMGCIDGLDNCFAGEEHNPQHHLLDVAFPLFRVH